MKVGDTVRFTREVVKRCGYDKYLAEMKGEILEIFGRTCRVNFPDRVRGVPLANLELCKKD